jgi:hypothetical protein
VSKPVVILCEDAAQRSFLRRIAASRGFSARDIDLVELPAGRGAGDRHVLSLYPREAASVRAESQYRTRGLLVAIDADANTVQSRHQQLNEVLGGCTEIRDDHRQPRGPREPIAIFVPKWHLETWIDYLLDGGPVSEDSPSARHGKAEPRHCEAAADRFLEVASAQAVPDDCPASLVLGLGELPRLPKAST